MNSLDTYFPRLSWVVLMMSITPGSADEQDGWDAFVAYVELASLEAQWSRA